MGFLFVIDKQTSSFRQPEFIKQNINRLSSFNIKIKPADTISLFHWLPIFFSGHINIHLVLITYFIRYGLDLPQAVLAALYTVNIPGR